MRFKCCKMKSECSKLELYVQLITLCLYNNSYGRGDLLSRRFVRSLVNVNEVPHQVLQL